jgi:polysaccharide biosynthesis protein PelE
MLIFDWLLQPENTGICWLVYSIFCIPLVLLMLWLLPVRFGTSKVCNFIFFYILSFTVFILGIFIAFSLVLGLILVKQFIREKEPIQTAEYPDYQRSPMSISDTYGEGFGFKVATSGELNKSVRQKMLVAINQFNTSGVNQINSQVLSDDVDEIRLYAKSLIEKQEREISQAIKYFTHKLGTTNDTSITAYYKKQIALVQWEQVYKHLVNNENLFAVLAKIKTLAQEAMSVLSEDMELPLLLAKIALKSNQLDEARKWLCVAAKNSAPEYKIISYLAEIDYLERNFTAIRSVLSSHNNKGIIGLQPIVSFWVTHD